MTAALIVAAVLIVLGLVAGEAGARTYRRRLADPGRSRMAPPSQRARQRR